MALTGKESKFCQEYLIDFNASRAAIIAGYSKKTARYIGHENLTKPHIKEEIRLLQDELRKSTGITPEIVVNELKALCLWNIQDFVDADNAIVNLHSLPLETTLPVIGIKTTTKTYKEEDGTVVKEVTSELKMHDKRGALSDLGKHLGIFEKDNEQKGQTIVVRRKSRT